MNRTWKWTKVNDTCWQAATQSSSSLCVHLVVLFKREGLDFGSYSSQCSFGWGLLLLFTQKTNVLPGVWPEIHQKTWNISETESMVQKHKLSLPCMNHGSDQGAERTWMNAVRPGTWMISSQGQTDKQDFSTLCLCWDQMLPHQQHSSDSDWFVWVQSFRTFQCLVMSSVNSDSPQNDSSNNSSGQASPFSTKDWTSICCPGGLLHINTNSRCVFYHCFYLMLFVLLNTLM